MRSMVSRTKASWSRAASDGESGGHSRVFTCPGRGDFARIAKARAMPNDTWE
jgi:hypothetical protein